MVQKKKYYVVWKGAKPGIYESWADCKKQIHGFDGAMYKSFENEEIAKKAFFENAIKHVRSKQNKSGYIDSPKKVGSPIVPSISVDAACSGNPGVMEYRCVDTYSKKELFKGGPFPEGTNNIGEFLAIVHALSFMKKQESNLPIYTDSTIAMKWVHIKNAKTKLEKTPLNIELFDLIDRATAWLNTNSWQNPILKWETKSWGEIPADFGRK